MSKETDEYLRGLYGRDDKQHDGPYVNWTRGGEATDDEYEAYQSGSGDTRRGGNDQSGWRRWEQERSRRRGNG